MASKMSAQTKEVEAPTTAAATTITITAAATLTTAAAATITTAAVTTTACNNGNQHYKCIVWNDESARRTQVDTGTIA